MGDRREYAVKGEDKDGNIVIIERGFRERASAEEHPIRMADWKRVWVENLLRSKDEVDKDPPLPWALQRGTGQHMYLVDADGFRFATLTGTKETKLRVGATLARLMKSLEAIEDMPRLARVSKD